MSLSLPSVVRKLSEALRRRHSGTYLSRLKLPNLDADYELHLSHDERRARLASIVAFSKASHHQIVDKSVYDHFLKELYPHHSRLGEFYTKFKTHNNVNHTSLYDSYCQLPQPGVAHMAAHDFEVFMKEMTRFRKWVRPNRLSSANLQLLKPKNVLQAYLSSLGTRKEHLNALLNITRDMKMAGIPLSNHERRGLIYKTFYRDRFDILQQVQRSLQEQPHYEKRVLGELQKYSFDMDTFNSLKDSFDALDADTLNVFLFAALRHNNQRVCSAVLSCYAPGSYNRDTFMILIENLSFLDKQKHLQALELLVAEYAFLIDIRLVNTILSSLVTMNEHSLADSLLSAIVEVDFPALEPCETFLKLLSHEDKRKYSDVLARYDSSPSKPAYLLRPTELTVLPFYQRLCEQGATFSQIVDLFDLTEIKAKLPLTSQMFKFVYLSLSRNVCRPQELRYVTGRLIESHDINNHGQDSWRREAFNEGTVPENLMSFLNAASQEAPEYDANSSNYIKLSSELMTAVFDSYKLAFEREPRVKNKVLLIEDDLAKQISATVRQSKLQKTGSSHVDLAKQEEVVYMRKISLIELFDIHE